MSELKRRSLKFFKEAIEEKKREIGSSLGYLASQKGNRTNPPKRISKQMLKRFFENNIIACKNNFYCCCCCKFLDSHCAAFEHTSQSEHCKFVDRAAATKRSWIILSERTNFELLVSEAIISCDANNFKCRICDDEMFAISKFAEHLQSFWHLFYSLRFDRTSVEQLDSEFSVFGDLEDRCVIVDTVENVCPDCANCTSDLSLTLVKNQMEESMRSTQQIVENIVKELKEWAAGQKILSTRSRSPDIQIIKETPSREIGATSKCQNVLLGSKKSATILKTPQTVITLGTRSPSSIDLIGTSRLEAPPNRRNICSENVKTATRPKIPEPVAAQETKSGLPIDSTRNATLSSRIEPPMNRQDIRSENVKTATRPKIPEPVAAQETKSSSPIDSTGIATLTSRIEPPPNCQETKKTASSPKIPETVAAEETKSCSPIVQKKTGPSLSRIAEAPGTRFWRGRYRQRKRIGWSVDVSSKSPEETSRIYLFCKQNLGAWSCKMCNKILTGSAGIAKHSAEVEHKNLYEKYGCENIKMIEASVYNCACCDCTIPGTTNVLAHLRGMRHSTCLAAKLRDKKSAAGQLQSANQAKTTPSDKKQELIVYVQHFQNLSIKKILQRRLKAREQSAAMINFECQYCHLHIVRSDDFHNHLASHISLELRNSEIDENDNDPHNFGLENRSTLLLNHVKPNSQNCKEKKTESNDFQVICTF